MSYLLVFLGAGLGGTLRHGVNALCLARGWLDYPYSTLIVNVVGSLLMGVLAGYFTFRTGANQQWKLFLGTGVLGGFTTFSTFSLDMAVLAERGQFGKLASYLVLSLGLGLLGLFVGLRVSSRP